MKYADAVRVITVTHTNTPWDAAHKDCHSMHCWWRRTAITGRLSRDDGYLDLSQSIFTSTANPLTTRF